MSGPIRIALLTGPCGPREPPVLALELVRELPPHGIAPLVAAGDGALFSRLAAAGADVVETPVSGRFILDFPSLLRLRRELEEREVSLLHVLDPSLTRHGAWLSSALGLPFLVSTDCPLPAVATPPDAILVPSRSVRDDLTTSWRTGDESTEVVPAGIRGNGSRPPSPPFGGGLPVIGTVTLRDDPRGLAAVLRAGKRLLSDGRELHILIAASDRAGRRLRGKARDLGVARNVTIASLPEAFMPIFRSLDLFVRPGRRGGFGVSVLSAMAAGRPVVAGGVGASFAFVKEGVTGYLAPRRDSAALAERIAWFLDHRDRAVRMGRAGRKLVAERFTPARFAERHAEIYRRVLAEGDR